MSKKNKENKARVSYTIEDLYNYAVSIGAEKMPLFLDYYCDDDWYDCKRKITEKDIEIDENGNGLNICIVQ